MKLVSIIIPVYNVEAYIDRCVQSIVGQTYRNIEIILINDGSTDASGAKCDAWKSKDDRIRVIHKPNGGLSDARNAGLETATGEYIGFVDSDDWVEPDMFELLVSNMEAYDADVSCCRFAYIYPDGKREPVGDDHCLRVYEGLDGLKEYLYGKTVDPFVWNKLYRADLLGGPSDPAHPIRFIQGILGEDNPFNTEVFKHSRRMVSAGEAKYNYLQNRPGAITSSAISQRKIDSVFWWDTVRKECHACFPDLEIYAVRRQALFYFGLYKDLYSAPQYQNEAERIRAFARENWHSIAASDVCERSVKLAAFLMAFVPRVYVWGIRTYKKIRGDVRL